MSFQVAITDEFLFTHLTLKSFSLGQWDVFLEVPHNLRNGKVNEQITVGEDVTKIKYLRFLFKYLIWTEATFKFLLPVSAFFWLNLDQLRLVLHHGHHHGHWAGHGGAGVVTVLGLHQEVGSVRISVSVFIIVSVDLGSDLHNLITVTIIVILEIGHGRYILNNFFLFLFC